MLAVDAIPRSRYVIFGLVSVLGCAADLLSKQLVFQWRGLPREGNEWWLWEPYVGIETAVNIGALFGMGGGFGHVFAGLSIVAAIGIVLWLFRFGAARDRWLTWALSLVMGGVFGNLYDRLGLWVKPGYPQQWNSGVRDWILFRYGEHTWPNFNIADSLLVCGAIMLMLHAFWEQPHTEASSPSKSDAAV
ncbi:MAG: signal peptidase II [Planctomycetales bacterium]|nr:signal peptidase II [Planctomycetales bacterium]